MLNVVHAERHESSTPTWAPRPEPRHARVGAEALAHWLMATLDEVDYGIVLLDEQGHTLHANHAARNELDGHHPLQLLGHDVRARRPEDGRVLTQAIQNAASRGLRRLLTLGEAEQRAGVAVVPLGGDLGAGGRVILLILSKPRICEALSVEAYARAHDLTPAETRVLLALAKGLRPEEAAQQLGVALCTVRTQTGMIRMKVGLPTIGAVLRQVALLPPLVTALRGRDHAGARAGLRRDLPWLTPAPLPSHRQDG